MRVAPLLALALLSWAVPAAAQPTASAAARQAYDQGTEAFEKGDFSTAARQFARADALAPHPVALRWALSASVKAGDPVLTMTLVDRAATHARDADLDRAVDKARASFADKVAALTVRCPPAHSCEARVDGSAVRVGDRNYYLPGTHRVEVAIKAGTTTDRWVELTGGQSSEIVGEAPVSAPSVDPLPQPVPRVEEEEEDGRGSPAWFGVLLGVTAVLGGVTIWSGVDTLSQHDEYLAAPTQDGYDDGRAAELRTNILIGVTAAAGVATIFVGIFAVRWPTSDTTTASMVW
jgi:hypothetical protein